MYHGTSKLPASETVCEAVAVKPKSWSGRTAAHPAPRMRILVGAALASGGAAWDADAAAAALHLLERETLRCAGYCTIGPECRGRLHKNRSWLPLATSSALQTYLRGCRGCACAQHAAFFTFCWEPRPKSAGPHVSKPLSPRCQGDQKRILVRLCV